MQKVEALTQKVQELDGLMPKADGITKDLMGKMAVVDAAYKVTTDNIAALQIQLLQYVNTPPAPPQVINVTVPPGVGQGTSGGGKTGKAIMDLKGFTKMDIFKGIGWLKWRNKLMTLVRMAYPLHGLECLEGAAKAKQEIEDVGLLTLSPTIDIDMQQDLSTDIMATLGFLVEGEPHDILSNCTNGFELWRRLEARYNSKTDTKTLNDITGVLSPEPAKSLGDVLGHIERWEEVGSAE